jgi:hypothetical protein
MNVIDSLTGSGRVIALEAGHLVQRRRDLERGGTMGAIVSRIEQ